jgi:branched-chain amino acid transport system permease protein
MSFLSYLLTGLGLGSVYAIIALGYTMVYGIAKMLNFAHGDIIMIGAYVAYMLTNSLNLSPILCILVSVLACIIIGVLIERLAYKPLRQASSLSVLITAIGVSYFLENSAQLIWGTDTKIFPNIISDGSFKLFNGRLSISYLTLITIFVCLIIMAILTLFINKTKIGKAMRASAEDKAAAQLMGINVDTTISITFAIGSGLAAIAAILLCCAYPAVSPTLGSMPGIKAFTAAVFGGIGSIPGALIGGILLGIIETFAKAYISTQLSDAIVFAVLIVVLLIKPTGLLGKKENVKV